MPADGQVAADANLDARRLPSDENDMVNKCIGSALRVKVETDLSPISQEFARSRNISLSAGR
jgi:hypothetical protein